MGKKKPEEMAKQRDIFVKGCARVNNIPAAKANQIFDLLEKFAGYGFNKSHAAAYAIVAYQTAYLKANYPVEFFCAMMTNDMADTAKLSQYIEEATGWASRCCRPMSMRASAFRAGGGPRRGKRPGGGRAAAWGHPVRAGRNQRGGGGRRSKQPGGAGAGGQVPLAGGPVRAGGQPGGEPAGDRGADPLRRLRRVRADAGNAGRPA
jgi:hypothetical protein